jgi:hypothetical protein
MNKLVGAFVMALWLGSGFNPAPAMAATAKPEAADSATSAKTAKAFPFRGKISALDITAKTITLPGKEKSRVFQVTAETRITKDGKPSTLEAAKIGDEVGGRALAADEGKCNLVVLRIGPKPETGKKGAADEEQDK